FLGVSSYPKVDLVENEKEYKLTADMPGCDKEDTTVEYSDNTLTISANHESHTEDKENGNYVRKERHSVSYKRSFYLPDVDEEKITGTFKNGVLKLALPKTAHHPKETKKIELN
ncbi:Hsp20/alpha crystallin family protein, partial [Enterococcus sp. HMSC067C01]